MPLESLAQQDFHVPRGDYYEVNIDIDSDDPENPGSLAGQSIEFECSRFTFLNPDPTQILFTKTLAGGGIEVISDPLMKIMVKIQPADTSGLTAPDIFYWQVRTTTAGGNPTVVSRGRLFLDQTI